MATAMGFEEGTITNGSINLHYRALGPRDGEPVIMLHGFPEFSYMWRKQMPELAEAGYRVIAPDMRGYVNSSRPRDVGSYRMPELISDLEAIQFRFGWPQVNLVGHDWGGVVAWFYTMYHAKRVKRLVAINAPHPSAYKTALQNPDQLLRNMFIGFFRLPFIPDILGETFVNEFVRRIFDTAHQANAFTEDDLTVYRDMLKKPGQVSAALNYYRANINPVQGMISLAAPSSPRARRYQIPMTVEVPVALIYGDHDFAFTSPAWTMTGDFCSGYYKAMELQNVGHWAPEEAPRTVANIILDHLKVDPAARPTAVNKVVTPVKPQNKQVEEVVEDEEEDEDGLELTIGKGSYVPTPPLHSIKPKVHIPEPEDDDGEILSNGKGSYVPTPPLKPIAPRFYVPKVEEDDGEELSIGKGSYVPTPPLKPKIPLRKPVPVENEDDGVELTRGNGNSAPIPLSKPKIPLRKSVPVEKDEGIELTLGNGSSAPLISPRPKDPEPKFADEDEI